jgi:predicted RNase H-like HicB family nuclease
MPENTTIAVIELTVEQRAGYTYVSSKDVPGLHLWGDDEEKVFRNIAPAIKILFKRNRGLDVEVVPASDPKEFPRPVPVRHDHVTDRYVMYPAQAACA